MLVAGVVAITQPGHAHNPEQIQQRYQRLQAAGVVGVVFLVDNDEPGETRAKQSRQAAAAIGMGFMNLPGVAVWPDLPEGGSIDSAPGMPAGRFKALTAAISSKCATRCENQPSPRSAPPFRMLGWCADRTRIFDQHSQTCQIAAIKSAAQPARRLQPCHRAGRTLLEFMRQSEHGAAAS